MSNTGWHMHKMGLVDFWLYKNEEFYFADGHMLLRGSNGSGKSVTMQSFIPLLLDGNKSSERLDPFGSRARKIEGYLLDEEGVHDNRIGYLYLEFKKGNSDLYITIGMGLHARRNHSKRVDAWYFVIEDNRRIGEDISLLHGNLALTKRELQNQIGENQIMDSQKEYMQRVNQVLFGFENTDEYKEAIDLLLQLRAPKLSNSFKPSVLNEVLSKSLQPLSEEELRPMSEAISSMDNIKDQLDVLNQSIIAAKYIIGEYTKYNYSVLFDKLEKYQREDKKTKELNTTIQKREKELKNLQEEVVRLQKEYEDLQVEEQVLKEKKDSLASQDIIRLKEEVERNKQELLQLKNDLHKKENQKEEKENRQIDEQVKCRELQEQIDDLEKKIQNQFEELDTICEEWYFKEHTLLKQEVLNDIYKSYDFSYTKKLLQEELEILNQSKNHFHSLRFYEKRITELNVKLLNLQEQLLEKDSELKQYETIYRDVIEEYKELYVQWNQNNTLLVLDNKDFNAIIQYLLSYEETKNYEPILSIVDDKRKNCDIIIEKRMLGLDFQRKETLKVLYAYEMELESWRNKKEVTPILTDDFMVNREYLDAHNIEYIPFYKILDFNESLSQIKRNQIEQMLSRTGLLEAIIVEQKDRELVLTNREKMADAYLFIEKEIASLSTIEIDEKISITEILNHIGYYQEHDIKQMDHYFQFSVLEGTVNSMLPSVYIGEVSREKYRQEKIVEFTDLVELTKKELNEIELTIDVCKKEQEKVEQEYQNFPTEEELYSAIQVIEDCRNMRKELQRETEKAEKEIQEIKMETQPIYIELKEIAKKLNIDMDEKSFLRYEDSAKRYQKELLILIDNHNNSVNYNILLNQKKEVLESINEDVDIITLEVSNLLKQMEIKQIGITQKQQQLETQEVKEIEVELDSVIARLEQIPTIKETISGNIKENVVKMDFIVVEQKNNEVIFEQQTLRRNAYFHTLKEEVSLGFFIQKDWVIEDILSLQKENDFIEVQEASLRLQKIYHNHSMVLQEYYLSITECCYPDKEWITDISPRLLVSAKYRGDKLRFEELYQRLIEDKEIQENILKEADRELFEDILVNSISKTIRYRIQKSKQWVTMMNTYMNAMNTSSGLKLHLTWKSQKAESDEQLDTRTLVDLLNRDVTLLKPNDLQNVSKHFRSKIEQARQMSWDENNQQSFHQIMRDVMDYRKWFVFTIQYQKGQEAKKELTNNAFSVFSGGEKAMAMYIPLFSAVAAKFDGGKKDAPIIIALDEAFAGVDENNIDNMFGLIEKFKFDYIMNSQVLWGDYPTVKALAIYELYRPNNAPYVTILEYRWNGSTKEYIAR